MHTRHSGQRQQRRCSVASDIVMCTWTSAAEGWDGTWRPCVHRRHRRAGRAPGAGQELALDAAGGCQAEDQHRPRLPDAMAPVHGLRFDAPIDIHTRAFRVDFPVWLEAEVWSAKLRKQKLGTVEHDTCRSWWGFQSLS